MQSETLIRAFQDMDRVGILTLRKIREDLLKVANAGGIVGRKHEADRRPYTKKLTLSWRGRTHLIRFR